jgi:SAM-dependent methyltransferase
LARHIDESVEPDDFEGALRLFFEDRDPSVIEHHVHMNLTMLNRLAPQLDGWLAPVLAADGVVLDVGCGMGGFVAAASRVGCDVVGIDASLAHLVFADRFIRSAGGTGRLACATAEQLPVADDSVAAVTLIDVIEHVDDRHAVAREVDRIASSSAVVAVVTPNRYSLAAEPHIGVWGVGLLPRVLQNRYARLRTEVSYDQVNLLSYRELRSMFGRESSLRLRAFDSALIPLEETVTFSPRKKLLAAVYNWLRSHRVTEAVLRFVAPSYNAIFVRG